MTADKRLPVVPKLRFLEFSKDPLWSSVKLGDVFDERQEKGFTTLPLLSVTDQQGVIPQEETNRKNNSNPDKSRYLKVVPGDIAYNTMRMWEGRSALVGMEGLVSPAYTVCSPRDHVVSEFWAYYFKTHSLIAQFRKYSQGLVKDTLNLKYHNFARIPVVLPLPGEQQKIADCLGSLDDLIAAEDRKLEALRQHKQGLMQQLFPQPGETVPRLRFPEFAHSPAWKHTILQATAPFATDRVPVDQISLADYISTENLVSDFGGVVPATRMPPSGSATLYQPGDILVANIRPYLRKVWRADRFGGASNDVIVMRPMKDIDPCFFEHVIKSDTFIAYVMRTAKGVKMPRGDLGSILEYAVFRPTSAEQQKIADCLNSLDNLIAAKDRKLAVLKIHKKGMMQQLFPSPDRH